MFPTESNLCRFSTEWIIWKILLKFTKKKPVGKSSQVKLEAHAQTCHCHEPTLKHVTAMGDSFTKFHGTFFYSEPLRMTISPIISYAFMQNSTRNKLVLEQFLKTLHLTSKETQGKYAACLPDLEHRVLDLIWNASFFNETHLYFKSSH